MENVNINIEAFNNDASANAPIENLPEECVDASIRQVGEQGEVVPIVESIELNLELTEADLNPVQSTIVPEVDEKLIASLKSSFYGGLIHIIAILSKRLKSSDILSIKKGHVLANFNGGMFFSDLTKVFADNDWIIKDPNGAIKKLNLIKGNDSVTILETQYKYILFNEAQGVIKQKTIIQKTQQDKTTGEIVRADPGELKYTLNMDRTVLSNLTTAKAAMSAQYYNILIDTDTFEIIEFNINEEFNEILMSSSGRNVMRYKTQELFPHIGNGTNILSIYKNTKGMLSAIFTTGTGISDGVHFQIPLSETPYDASVDFGGI